ncbi:MAG: Rieske 2Fe-2S domain-containing protein [Acidobacteria bacterium]|nr:Rieske 2Fe-2S domain-containing protein [Acidobacteriota bacterium]
MNRRDLLRAPLLLALSKPCCELPVLQPQAYQKRGSSLVIDLRQAAHLKKVGGAALVRDEARQLYLILAQTAPGEFHAWHGACTHGGAPLAFDARHGTALCTSVGHSEFNPQGEVVRGPAPKPVRIFPVQRAGNTLTVQLEAAQ